MRRDEILKKLRKVSAKCGADRQRMVNGLHDLFPVSCLDAQTRREANWLEIAVLNGVAEKIAGVTGVEVDAVIAQRLVLDLYERYGTERNVAEWMIDIWALALDKRIPPMLAASSSALKPTYVAQKSQVFRKRAAIAFMALTCFVIVAFAVHRLSLGQRIAKMYLEDMHHHAEDVTDSTDSSTNTELQDMPPGPSNPEQPYQKGGWQRVGGAEAADKQGLQLMDLWGTPQREMFAVGMRINLKLPELNEGIILYRASEHEEWKPQRSGKGFVLHSIWGNNAQDVYAVGVGGLILHSTNRGKDWFQAQSGTRATLTSVWGSGADDIYVVGDDPPTILHSADGGRNWVSINRKVTGNGLRGVWGSGPDDVWAVGWAGTILHSRQGLQGFVELKRPAELEDGRTKLYGVWGLASKTIFVVGEHGLILRSSDRGQTWIRMESGTKNTLISIGGTEDGGLYAAGMVGSSNAVIYSKDLGVTWTTNPLGDGVQMHKVNKILATVDGIYLVGQPAVVLHHNLAVPP